VTSATIEDQKFADYFNNAPVVKIPGKMYPVETRYLPLLRGGMSMFMSSMHKSEQYVQVRQNIWCLDSGNGRAKEIFPLWAMIQSSNIIFFFGLLICERKFTDI